MASIVNVVTTDCGGCMAAVKVDLDRGQVSTRIPSNGVRGKNHKPAHVATQPFDSMNDTLAFWDCPACGYADSTYVDPDVRADLS